MPRSGRGSRIDVPNPKGPGEAATWASFFPPCCSQKPRCWHVTDSRHAVCARTFLGHAIRPEKIAFSPGTAAGRSLGRAVQSPGRERCSLQKSCSQHFFFLGDVVLKEEPLRDARMERLRWVWGGKCCYFGKIPLSSCKSPCGRTLRSTSACPCARAPPRIPLQGAGVSQEPGLR